MLRVFENRVLRRIFGPKRDEVTELWRNRHNEELNDLYSSLTIVWVMNKMGGVCTACGERRGVYRVLVGKPDEKRPLGIPRLRWKDSIKIDLQGVGCGGMNCIELVQDRQVADACECGNEPSGSIKCAEFLD
jgi:hypothetical protein